MFALWSFSLLLLAASSFAAPAQDLVTNLPGLNFVPNFKHYSGYLQASPKHFFHYWFAQSQGNPATDPVILWLNGGPGCSSVGGMMDELGPFHAMDFGGTIYENVYAWNKVGSVIFMESPAGVGYSYSTDGNLQTNDDEVATDNYNALLYFFQTKFPELKNNDFYITGESYGGVYLPTLGALLAKDKTNFPTFKGMAIGNGVLSFPLNYNTMVPLFYYHGLMRQSLWDSVSSECCNGNPTTCDYYTKLNSQPCRSLIIKQLDSAEDLNPYNLYASCYLPPKSKKSFIKNSFLRMAGIKPEELTMSNLATNIPICAQDNATETYVNRADVRTALHIPSSRPHWTDCNDYVNEHYTINYSNMVPQVNAILNAGVRVLIYNGDIDSVCNNVMNRQFIQLLGRSVLGTNTDMNKPWKYANEEPNIAGFVTKYSGGLDFVTVRGAGHFVPADKGREALQLIYNFIKNRDYSTPTGLSTAPQPPASG
uniref:Carboxypeptidase n=1 Tax=Plectus sambesii TaxID=2011161 RepID=A0A914V0K8_9BILA